MRATYQVFEGFLVDMEQVRYVLVDSCNSAVGFDDGKELAIPTSVASEIMESLYPPSESEAENTGGMTIVKRNIPI